MLHEPTRVITLLRRAAETLEREGVTALERPHALRSLHVLLAAVAADMEWVEQRRAEHKQVDPTVSDNVLFRHVNLALAIVGEETAPPARLV